MKLSAQQSTVLVWGGVGLLGVAAVYLIAKYGLPKLASGAGGGITDAIKGFFGSISDSLTSGQHDFSGQATDAYANKGVVGDLGAVVNSTLGGLPASAGETLGDGLYSVFGDQPTGIAASNVTYIVSFPDGSRHAVDSSNVDASGNFSYAGQEFRLGQDGMGNRVAVRRTTIYGSGAG